MKGSGLRRIYREGVGLGSNIKMILIINQYQSVTVGAQHKYTTQHNQSVSFNKNKQKKKEEEEDKIKIKIIIMILIIIIKKE